MASSPARATLGRLSSLKTKLHQMNALALDIQLHCETLSRDPMVDAALSQAHLLVNLLRFGFHNDVVGGMGAALVLVQKLIDAQVTAIKPQ